MVNENKTDWETFYCIQRSSVKGHETALGVFKTGVNYNINNSENIWRFDLKMDEYIHLFSRLPSGKYSFRKSLSKYTCSWEPINCICVNVHRRVFTGRGLYNSRHGRFDHICHHWLAKAKAPSKLHTICLIRDLVISVRHPRVIGYENKTMIGAYNWLR